MPIYPTPPSPPFSVLRSDQNVRPTTSGHPSTSKLPSNILYCCLDGTVIPTFPRSKCSPHLSLGQSSCWHSIKENPGTPSCHPLTSMGSSLHSARGGQLGKGERWKVCGDWRELPIILLGCCMRFLEGAYKKGWIPQSSDPTRSFDERPPFP